MILLQVGRTIGCRPWLHCVVLSLGLNALFLALSFTPTVVPREIIVQRVRQAYATGELVKSDYIWYDARRGWHQYNDCNILQMITNTDSSRTGQALGPLIYFADSSTSKVCSTLHELVVNERRPEGHITQRYSRYWHGYIPITSALLSVLEISSVRATLRGIVYASILLLLLVGVRERCFFPLTAAVATAGALFWGLRYFGQGLSHAPGDSVVILGIACLIWWYRKLARPGTLLPFCALFGAIVVYFEMLTGPLPTAAGLIFPTVYVLSRLTNPLETLPRRHFELATAALIAFVLGATLTVAAKVAAVAALLQRNGLDVFLGNLYAYTRPVDMALSVKGFLLPLIRLARSGPILTYGSSWGLGALYMSAALAWLAAAWVAWKRRSRLAWADFAAYVVGASSIPAWTVIMPTHTIIHAAFMTRILIVPISLGWAALLWQMWPRKNLLFVPARSVGDGIYSAMGVGKSVVCLPWFWRWIMAMIKIVPESLFKKISL